MSLLSLQVGYRTPPVILSGRVRARVDLTVVWSREEGRTVSVRSPRDLTSSVQRAVGETREVHEVPREG